MKRILSFFLLAAAIFSLTACKKASFTEGTVTFHIKEMAITLPANFKESTTAMRYSETAGYNNDYLNVQILIFRKPKKDYFKATGVLETVNEFLCDESRHTSYGNDTWDTKELRQEQGIYYIKKGDLVNNQLKTLFYTAFEHEDYFWLIRISSNQNKYEELFPQYLDWIKTVRFEKADKSNHNTTNNQP